MLFRSFRLALRTPDSPAITEAKKAIEARDVGKLKSAWNWIKNVASSATGGVISAGVLKLLSQANF
jgi:hypothetical protein